MRHILGLDLHNVVTFKKLSVDFSGNLTYVRGLNLDSDPATPTGNGAGKTLMFSTLANLFFQTTPLAQKKKSKKDILRQKGSSIGAIYRPSDDGPEYEIIQSSKGYTIYEDGKDLELRTIPIAEEFIRKIFPMTETKFYSYCYLSTQRPYLLQRDTDANRLTHLADIFNLDQYSSIREVLAIRLRSINDNELKLSVLEQQRLSLSRKLKELKAPLSKSEYAEAKTRYDALTAKLDKLKNQKFTLTSQQRDLDALYHVEVTLDELRDLWKFDKHPGKMLKRLKRDRDASLLWDRYDSRVSQVKHAVDKLQKQIDALEVPSASSKKLQKSLASSRERLSILQDEISHLRAAEKAHQRIAEKLSSLQAEFDALGISSDIPTADYASEVAVLKSTVKLEHLLEHDHEDSKCPTCQTSLDFDEIRTAVVKAKKRLRKIEAFAHGLRLKSKISELTEALPEFDADDLATKLSEKKAIQSKIESLSEQLEQHSEYESLIRQRDGLEFPEKPDCARPEHSVEEIDEHLDLCGRIVEALSQKEVLLSNHEEYARLRSAQAVKEALKDVSKKSDSLDAELTLLQSKQGSIASKISEYDQHRNTHGVYERELAELEAKIAKLKPATEDKKLLEILVKAYGAKGLRATAATSVCHLLQTNLNHYRDLIFAEPFTFEVKASDTGVSILVDRNNGKPDSVSDVRNLSGAESNSFQLLCLISLLPLIPDQERLNMVVLDEPTSHMDAVSRTIFNERFVPVLREIVPNTYIISPHADDTHPDSAEWVVRKQGGISTLLAD